MAEAMTVALSPGGATWIGSGVRDRLCHGIMAGRCATMQLGHYPLSWVAHPEYLWMTAGAALLTALGARALRRLRSLFSAGRHRPGGVHHHRLPGGPTNVPLTIVLVSGTDHRVCRRRIARRA